MSLCEKTPKIAQKAICRYKQGLPDEFVRKIAQNVAQAHFFVKINSSLFLWKKVHRKVRKLLYLSKNSPIVQIGRRNLVTLDLHRSW
jgi:hypothetical protein